MSHLHRFAPLALKLMHDKNCQNVKQMRQNLMGSSFGPSAMFGGNLRRSFYPGEDTQRGGTFGTFIRWIT